jgi:hypothetical protein
VNLRRLARVRVGLAQPRPERPQALARRWNLQRLELTQSKALFRLRQVAKVVRLKPQPGKPMEPAPEPHLPQQQAAVLAQRRRPEQQQPAEVSRPRVQAPVPVLVQL